MLSLPHLKALPRKLGAPTSTDGRTSTPPPFTAEEKEATKKRSPANKEEESRAALRLPPPIFTSNPLSCPPSAADHGGSQSIIGAVNISADPPRAENQAEKRPGEIDLQLPLEQGRGWDSGDRPLVVGQAKVEWASGDRAPDRGPQGEDTTKGEEPVGAGGGGDGRQPPGHGGTAVRRVVSLFFVYSYQLELAVFLPLGPAFPSLKQHLGRIFPYQQMIDGSCKALQSEEAVWECIPLDTKKCIFLIYCQAGQGCLRGEEPMGISILTND